MRFDLLRESFTWLARPVLAGLLLCASSIGAASAQTVASTHIGTTSLISPTAADGYYGSSTTSTNGLGLSQRPNEIRELARALRNDPDLIYDYVRNNIEIEWAYGLRKGALGALLDHSGTAFDQAKLMVDLLREAGYSASYQAGTITLSGSQFADWSGITNASAACQLLSGGAIPASINGSTTADCNYGSASVSTITLSHIWVSVTIGGSSYLFDPSYKPHAFLAGINLNTATGMTAGQAFSSATSGMSTGTASGVSYAQNLNTESLTSTLQTLGTNLETYIATNAPSASVDDITGGQRIVRYDAPSGGLRQTSLPYTASVQHSWSGDIPDQYRTKLTVQMAKDTSTGVATVINSLVYIDEIYGRKLILDSNYVAHANHGVTTNIFTLRLTNNDGSDVASIAQYTEGNDFLDRDGSVTLIANHPYASAADGTSSVTGDYMDETVVKQVSMLLPLTIVNAWGDANSGLMEAWGQRNDTQLPKPHVPDCDTCPAGGYRASKGDARREQLAVSWMVQASRAARLHAAIGHGVFTLHHALGVVVADVQPRVIGLFPEHVTPPANQNYYFGILDSFDRVDVEDAFSYVNTSASAADRRAAILAIAATRDALEASVPGQIADLPDTTSTATRFDWGNRPPTAEDPSSGYGPRRFYQFNTSNVSQALPLAVVEGQTSVPTTCPGTAPLSNNEVQTRRNKLSDTITSYANAGFDVVSSEEAFLGPGQRIGAEFNDPLSCGHDPSMQRGGALVAVRSVSGEPVEIAHVVVGAYSVAKGGGGGAQTTHQAQYDPSTAADILKSRFVDRSSAVGVDLHSGAVTYASPAQLSVGNGDFPYRLSANLIWRGGFEPADGFGPQLPSQPAAPWTSNWHNMLSVSASGLEAMGQSDPRAAAGTIAAFLAQQDVYRSTYSPQREAAGLLVGAWWLKQVSGNVVTVNVGVSTRQFVRDVAGQWLSPGASAYATLTEAGARTVGTLDDCSTVPSSWALTRGWLYDGVSFQVRSANGDVQNFANWSTIVDTGSTDSTCATARGFRMSSWTFPRGVTINLTYTALDGFSAPVLSQVSNTLGRVIRLNYTGAGAPNAIVWAGYDNGLFGADARAVTRCSDETCIHDASAGPTGPSTRFTMAMIAGERRLTEVYDADDTTTASLRYTYDTLGRVMEARDAVALQGTRNPYLFRIATGARAEREDPLGGRYTIVSNIFDSAGAHWQRFIDELGNVTQFHIDGLGRTDRTIYPELDEERFTFDARNRVTQMRRVAKPSSGLADIVINATWDDAWNKPATITDARGYRTDFTYIASGNGAGELATAVRPAPSGSTPVGTGTRPTYTLTYGSFGRLETSTDPTGLVSSNSINATTGNISSTTLEPTGINATTSFVYDANGEATSAADPRGNVTETSYDAMRRPLVVLHHNGAIGAALLAAERTNYNVLGQVTSTEGGTAFSGTSVTTWLTRESRTYTPTGKVARVTDGAGDIAQTAYDGHDRVLCTAVRMNPAVYGSLPTDACTLSTLGANGPDHITRFIYDAAGQQAIETRAYAATGYQQDYATYTYSPNGQRLSVKDANSNLSSYVYDGFDRLAELHFPSTTLGAGTSSTTDYEGYGYDLNGNRTSLRLRSSEQIMFDYDNLNRQTWKHYPSGSSMTDVHSGYDFAGRPLFVRASSSDTIDTSCNVNASGVDYCYDTAGRLTDEGTYGRRLSFQFDLASNRTRITWPDTFYAQYSYDGLNRVSTIGENGATSGTGLLATYTYDGLGRRATLTRGDGTTATFTYDNASRLTGLAQDLPSTANDQTLGFAFTPASQIVTRSASNDAFNWVAPTISSRTYTRNGLNQYTAVGGSAFNYDSRGNLISDGSRNFQYDLENHLLQVSGSASMTLAYDPLGRLQQTVAGAITTQFLYDGDRLSAEFDGSGNIARRYVHGPGVDEPLAWYECPMPITTSCPNTDRRYLIADNQGTVIAEDGASVVRYPSGPYGEPSTWTGSRFRYTGQIALPEVQLYHYKARVYDPVLGRFLQTDPVGYLGDMDTYDYGGDDPINAYDPSGLAQENTCSRVGAVSCSGDYGGSASYSAPNVNWSKPFTSGSFAPTEFIPGLQTAPPTGTYPRSRFPTAQSRMDSKTQSLYDAATAALNGAEAWYYRRQMGRSAEQAFERELVRQHREFFAHPIVRTSLGIRIPDFAVLGSQGWFFVEVKAGLSDPPRSQMRKDLEIEEHGFVGLTGPLLGIQGPTDVRMFKTTPTDLGGSNSADLPP